MILSRPVGTEDGLCTAGRGGAVGAEVSRRGAMPLVLPHLMSIGDQGRCETRLSCGRQVDLWPRSYNQPGLEVDQAAEIVVSTRQSDEMKWCAVAT